jgi:hypothetical protein
MKSFFARVLLVYLACGLALHLLFGGSLWSLSTPLAMLLWPFILAGIVAKLLFAAILVAVAYWTFFRRTAAGRH